MAEQFLRQPIGISIKHYKIDLHLVLQQKCAESGNSDLQRLVLREPIVSGRNQRECNRFTIMFYCQFQRIIVAVA